MLKLKQNSLRPMVYLILFLVMPIGKSTTFFPVSMDKKLKESQVVIHGTYLGKSYKRLSNGKVATEVALKIIQSQGLSAAQIINRNEFKVLHPGGKWGDIETHIDGIPKFKSGEEVVVLLRKDSAKNYWINSLAAGKYTVESKSGKKTLRSNVFPHHPSLGKIKMEDFNLLVEQRFGEGLAPIPSEKVVIKRNNNPNNRNKKGRNIASKEEEIAKEETDSSSSWIVVVFLLLAVISAVRLKRNR